MRIIEAYVLGQLLKVFSLVVVALTVMLVVVGVVGEAAKNGLGPGQIVQILPWVVPSLMPYTIPATLLLTVCVVYGRMAGDQEVTALKSAGVNVMVVLWPALILASLLSLATFLLTDYFIPLARSRIEQIITLAMEDIFLDQLRQRNQFTDPYRGIAITVDRLDDKKLVNPVFRYTPYGGQPVTIAARSATLRFDMQEKQVVVTLENAFLETAGGDLVRMGPQQQHKFPLPINIQAVAARNTPIEQIHRDIAANDKECNDLVATRTISTAFGLTRGDFAMFTADDYQDFSRKLQRTEERHNKLRTAIHERVTLACSCFFFTLIGAPYAVTQGKRQFLTSFAVCFTPILLVYYPISLLMMNLGKDGKVDPAWGMWAGNLVLGLAACVVLKRVLKH